ASQSSVCIATRPMPRMSYAGQQTPTAASHRDDGERPNALARRPKAADDPRPETAEGRAAVRS
ncbi:MAG: hypothetical protein AAFN74_26310, partial [Myxococcota bacterium]